MLLLIAHAPTETTERLAAAIERGARDPEAGDVDVVRLSPFDVTPDRIRAAKAVVLFTPANFGYMSGALKDCFDRCYEPLLGNTNNLSYALVVRGRSDTSGAISSIERIVRGLKWRAVAAPISLVGDYDSTFEFQCAQLGQTMAAGLSMGIF